MLTAANRAPIVAFDRSMVVREAIGLLTERLDFDASWFAEGRVGGGAEIAYTSGTTAQLRGVYVRSGLGLCGRVLAEGSVAVVEGYLESSDITHHYDGEISRERIRSVVAAPIVVAGEPMSVLLGAVRDDRGMGDRAAAMIAAIAQRTSRALESLARGAAGSPTSYVALSPRERDVLRALAHGDSNREIAEALDIRITTVKTYVAHVMHKLQAKNRTQAAAKARELDLF